MTRVYDLCHGCRLCFKFCTVVPDAVRLHRRTRRPGRREAHDPAEQDQVVDECFQCKLCYVNCPYIPGQHEWALDFPRLMMRADQVRFRDEKRSVKTKLTDKALARTDLLGKGRASAAAPLANAGHRHTRVAAPQADGEDRRYRARARAAALRKTAVLSTWFKKRSATRRTGRPANARATWRCSRPVWSSTRTSASATTSSRSTSGTASSARLPRGAGCCGAPRLHQGDVDGVRRAGPHNIAVLAEAVREADAAATTSTIVVPQPTCGYILKKDYVDYVGGPDAEPRRRPHQRRRRVPGRTSTRPRTRRSTPSSPARCPPR